MSFSEMVTYGDQVLVAQFGEPVTLEFETTLLTIQAVVDLQAENVEPLVPGNSRQSFTLTLPSTIADQITPEWTAIVRGQRRPVLETIPSGSGLSTVWLGDAEVDPDAF